MTCPHCYPAGTPYYQTLTPEQLHHRHGDDTGRLRLAAAAAEAEAHAQEIRLRNQRTREQENAA